MTSLYDLTDEYNGIFSGLDAMREEGEIDAETFNDTLSAVATEFEEKAINVGYYIKNMKSNLEELKNHKSDIDAKMKTMGNRIDWYENYLRTSMAATKKDAISSPLLSIKLGKPSLVVSLVNEKAIPDKYKSLKASIIIDKKALKEDLKNDPVEGAELVPGKARLNIK